MEEQEAIKILEELKDKIITYRTCQTLDKGIEALKEKIKEGLTNEREENNKNSYRVY